jgi:transcriptional regulator with XRE-family HTH domain
MSMTVNEYLGSTVRTARRRMELTQAEVASRLGLATAVYGRIERGCMTPSLLTLMQLCAVLELDANMLLGFTSSTPPPWLAPVPAPAHERPAVSKLRPLLQRLTRQQVLALANLAHCMLPTRETRDSREPQGTEPP